MYEWTRRRDAVAPDPDGLTIVATRGVMDNTRDAIKNED
jgi:hypothetical protein